MPSHTEPEPAGEQARETRDFVAEFTSFLREHQISISVEEVYHLNPMTENADEIRQHNCVTVRSPRSKRPLSLCYTSYNWEDLRVTPSDVIRTLASDASIFEMSEGSFVGWCASLEWSADSRGAERKFRQTFEAVGMLRELLGDAAYRELLEMRAEAAVVEFEEDEEDWDGNGDGVTRL